jgi:hypothetical protein
MLETLLEKNMEPTGAARHHARRLEERERHAHRRPHRQDMRLRRRHPAPQLPHQRQVRRSALSRGVHYPLVKLVRPGNFCSGAVRELPWRPPELLHRHVRRRRHLLGAGVLRGAFPKQEPRHFDVPHRKTPEIGGPQLVHLRLDGSNAGVMFWQCQVI